MANLFWVGGTGNWSQTAHWSSTSGGTGGQPVPVVGDTVTIDGSLSSGTLTINQTVACGSIDWTTAVGTISNTGNFNITLDGSGFVGTGSTARTWIGGTGFIKITGGNGSFNVVAATGWTNVATAFAGNTVIFEATPVAGNIGNNSILLPATCVLAGLTLNLGAKGSVNAPVGGSSPQLGALTINAGCHLMCNNDIAVTSISGTGTASNPIGIISTGQQIWITIASGSYTLTWAVMRGIHFNPTAGATLTVTNGLNMGGVDGTGITITAPSGGGGGGTVGVIGG